MADVPGAEPWSSDPPLAPEKQHETQDQSRGDQSVQRVAIRADTRREVFCRLCGRGVASSLGLGLQIRPHGEVAEPPHE